MNKLYSNKSIIFVLVFPAFILFALFIPIPTIMLLVSSFSKWDVISPMKFVGLQNYIFIFTKDMYFWKAFLNNTLWLIFGLVLQIIPAFLLGLLLSSKIRGKNFFRNLSFLPVALSGTAVSMIWYFVYHHDIGILNQLIRFLGYEDFNKAWLMDEKLALFCVLIAVAWQWTGYYTVIFLSGISQVPMDLLESAKIDGAGYWRTVFSIIIPYLKPIFKVTILLSSVSAFKGFDLIYVMTRGGPNHATDLLALQMYEKSFTSGLYGYGGALGVIILCMCLIVTLIVNLLFKDSQND